MPPHSHICTHTHTHSHICTYTRAHKSSSHTTTIQKLTPDHKDTTHRVTPAPHTCRRTLKPSHAITHRTYSEIHISRQRHTALQRHQITHAIASHTHTYTHSTLHTCTHTHAHTAHYITIRHRVHMLSLACDRCAVFSFAVSISHCRLAFVRFLLHLF